MYTSPSGIIRSPTSTEQWEELECEWKIQLSVGKRIQIYWTTFELLKNNCHMEYIEVTFSTLSIPRLRENILKMLLFLFRFTTARRANHH